MEYKDYYKILGVSRDAGRDEIKRAYRKLARKYHPDVSKEPDADARFKEIAEAYKVLKDPKKRSAYDGLGRDWQAGQEFRPPPGWRQGFEFHTEGFSDADAGRFSEFFENLFAGFHARSDVPMHGEHRYARIDVDLEDAFRGAERTLRLPAFELDPSGGRPRSHTRTLRVRIPAGVTEGQHIRLAGQGGVGAGGGPAGDLFLEVRFRPHPLFRAQGRDVFLSLPLSPWEAALGAQIEVPTLGGRVSLTIPPGAQTGRKLRLKGRGLPGPLPGDQYVILQIVVPPARTDKDRDIYRHMAEAMDFDPRADLEA